MTAKPERKTIDDLLAIMAALRAPGTGCPWDLVQSFETIAPYTIEEAYEVADAIERRDMEDLRQELGDLLLQVVYHAQMASEAGAFDFRDVVDAVAQKMVRRHPHVFAGEMVRDAGELEDLWERIKREEKADRSSGEPESGALKGVPRALPAMTRALKLQSKAARVGFDWSDLKPVMDKVREELAELEAELAVEADGVENQEKIRIEFGDFLFAATNLGRHLALDPESALSAANAKFVRRFERIETIIRSEGRRIEDLDLAQLERLWNRAKAEEAEPAEPGQTVA
jgi:ATP diphosphatase